MEDDRNRFADAPKPLREDQGDDRSDVEEAIDLARDYPDRPWDAFAGRFLPPATPRMLGALECGPLARVEQGHQQTYLRLTAWAGELTRGDGRKDHPPRRRRSRWRCPAVTRPLTRCARRAKGPPSRHGPRPCPRLWQGDDPGARPRRRRPLRRRRRRRGGGAGRVPPRPLLAGPPAPPRSSPTTRRPSSAPIAGATRTTTRSAPARWRGSTPAAAGTGSRRSSSLGVRARCWRWGRRARPWTSRRRLLGEAPRAWQGRAAPNGTR